MCALADDAVGVPKNDRTTGRVIARSIDASMPRDGADDAADVGMMCRDVDMMCRECLLCG